MNFQFMKQEKIGKGLRLDEYTEKYSVFFNFILNYFKYCILFCLLLFLK